MQGALMLPSYVFAVTALEWREKIIDVGCSAAWPESMGGTLEYRYRRAFLSDFYQIFNTVLYQHATATNLGTPGVLVMQCH